MSRIKLAVLFGGSSSEHAISLLSATSVLNNLDTTKYDVIPVGITKKGRWLFYPGPFAQISSGAWEKCPDNVSCFLSPDTAIHGLVKILADQSVTLQRIDAVFPVLHGKNGEDGTIQGLLSMSGIPYVGCDTLSSAACMDKAVTHTILTGSGICNAKYEIITRQDADESEKTQKRLESSLGYPMFIKPANAGSSIGINRVDSGKDLSNAIHLALAHDCKVVAEQQIEGAEIECAVLGNDTPIASVPGEILPSNAFYDYEAKYISEASKLIIPANISPELSATVRSIAVSAYQAMGCSGMARVDFFVNKQTGAVTLNEINTIPGFTAISMYPKLFEQSGIPYPVLLTRLIDFAIEKSDRTSL